jgi:hypothetical protein
LDKIKSNQRGFQRIFDIRSSNTVDNLSEIIGIANYFEMIPVRCHALTLVISVFFIFWLGQGVTRVGMLVFVLSRVFVCLEFFVFHNFPSNRKRLNVSHRRKHPSEQNSAPLSLYV